VRRLTAALATLAAVLTAVLVAPPGTAHAADPPQTVAAGRVHPWGLALLPDGGALFTERDSRRIYAIGPSGGVRHVYTVTEAVARGEGGLLGIAVGPDHLRDQRVHLYYTTAGDNRIAYITRGSAARPTPIVTGIPAASTHNGGRLAFSPDGLLFAGTGDAQVPERAQQAGSLGGKILRMTKDGKPVPGNPYGSVVFSTGHRNVQGLAFDDRGRLWASEFGQRTYDEINHIQVGNYGWPIVEGRGNDPRFVEPKHVWSPAEASPSGLEFAGGSLYAAALRGQRLWRLELSGTTVTRATSMYEGTFGRLRAAERHPEDGAMWLLTGNGSNDRVVRIPRFP
jgi:glucose/arabinose dehydrogenase